jgi:hypothetical protein
MLLQNENDMDYINNSNVNFNKNNDFTGEFDGKYRKSFSYDLSRNSSFSNNEKINDDKIYSVIYRYKFTEEFMEQLHIFSKIHQYDERNDFKDAWSKWVEENQEIIKSWTEKLDSLLVFNITINEKFKHQLTEFPTDETTDIVAAVVEFAAAVVEDLHIRVCSDVDGCNPI